MRTLSLDEKGVLEGTDKSSGVNLGWDYLRHYATWFSPWQDREINVIEIGVASGASLRTMREFFSKPMLVGIDIEPGCLVHAGEGVAIEIGSQDDPVFLDRVITQYPPTIVVDDGSHLAHHIIFSFEAIFPRLQPGGLYVVEDLAFHFGEDARHLGQPIDGSSAVDYFTALAKSLLSRRSTPRPEFSTLSRDLSQEIEFIQFIDGALVVGKKENLQPAFDVEPAIAYVQSKGMPIGDAIGRYCEYGVRAGVDMKRIELAFEGVSPSERAVPYYLAYTSTLWNAGDCAAAIRVAEEGMQRCRESPEMPWRLGYYLCEMGRLKEGVASLKRAASFYPNYFDQIIDMIMRFCNAAGADNMARDVLRDLAEGTAEPVWRDAVSVRLG